MLKVFVSYSIRNSNKSLIERLTSDLSSYDIDAKDYRYGYTYNEDLTGALLNHIRKSDVFLAFIDSDNSNVFLELGYAIGIGKPILIVCSSDVDLPIHLSNFTYIRSDTENNNLFIEIVMYLEKIKADTQSTKGTNSAFELSNREGFNKTLSLLKEDPNNLQNIDAMEFEELVYYWFYHNGFYPERAQSSDHGYDFVIRTKGHRTILVEVKKFSLNSNITVMKVQQLLGAVHGYRADGGLIITTSSYTNSARDFAEKCHPNIVLLDIEDMFSSNFHKID